MLQRKPSYLLTSKIHVMKVWDTSIYFKTVRYINVICLFINEVCTLGPACYEGLWSPECLFGYNEHPAITNWSLYINFITELSLILKSLFTATNTRCKREPVYTDDYCDYAKRKEKKENVPVENIARIEQKSCSKNISLISISCMWYMEKRSTGRV